MQQQSKKLRIISLGLSLLASIIFLLDVLFMNSIGIRVSAISSQSLAILKAISIFLSVYSIVVAWFFQFRRATLSDRLSRRKSRLSPEANFLLITYLLLLSPSVFGLFLFICGIPLREYFYFLGVSLVMILVWGFYDIRRI